MCRVFELGEELNSLIKDISAEKDKLGIELSALDQELCDIYHYIEFNNLDIVKGYKAYKTLQDCLQRRRRIKNELLLAQKINANDFLKLSDNIEDALSFIDSQKYTPRVREDLFSNESVASAPNKALLSLNKVQTGQMPWKAVSASGEILVFNNLGLASEFIAKKTGVKLITKGMRKNINAQIRKSADLHKQYANYLWECVEK